MSLHKLLHFSFLLKLIWCWKTLLLLSHIKHHLLNSWSCFTIKIWKLWWLRINFLSINLSVTFNWSAPPWGLIFPLFNIDMNILAFISINLAIFNRPICFLRINFTLPFSIYQTLTFYCYLQFFHWNVYFSCLFSYIGIDKNEHFEILL